MLLADERAIIVTQGEIRLDLPMPGSSEKARGS